MIRRAEPRATRGDQLPVRPPAVLLALAALCVFAAAARGAGDGPTLPGARAFGIARLKYGGGGDWYENRTSLANLIRAAQERLSITTAGAKEAVVEPGSAALFQYPFVYACGHGNLKLTPTEAANLRRYLTTGGFLWVDDDFGIDPSFRRAIQQVLPEDPLVELPFSHPLFHGFYDFPAGLPKIHEHDGGPARAYGVFHDGRLVVFYSFDTDLGDGLEDPGIHDDPPEKREAALRMSLNLVHYVLTH
jgi:hypothetical protein